MPRAQPPWSKSQKTQLAATVFAVFLLAIYATVAVFAQPVSGTVDESDRSLSGLAGYPDTYNTGLYHLHHYVDGGTFTVTKWVTNSGFVPLTITGVDPA